MRRKLAYILLNCALIVGVGSTVGSAIMNMDTDVTYGSGRDLYFRILEHNDERNGLITDVNEDDYVSDDQYYAVNTVAEEMEDRLEGWGINASVRKEGYDTVVVSVRTQEDESVDYTYLQNYLAFSGGDITVAAGSASELDDSNPSGREEFIDNNMFEGHTATIEYVDNIPVVAIEVNYPGENGAMAELIDYCVEHTTEGTTDEDGNETAGVNCFLVLWTNIRAEDNFAQAYDPNASDYDPIMSSRLIFGENAQNAWYDEDNDDDDYTRLQLLPNSEAIQDGVYDESKADSAYKAARYYCGLLNASSYAEKGQAGSDGYDVMFAYSSDITPTVESLLTGDAWHWVINNSATAIATLCALLVTIVILAVFYRMGSLAIISSLLVSVEGAVLILGYFGSQFNIAMLVGLLLGGLTAIFGGAYYFSKMREQLYQGRSPKKAHSEASKKSVWPILDAGIISIVLGLCVYYLIPANVGALGISLVWTSAFATIYNLVVLRFAGWLLANSNKAKDHYGRYYLVDESKVPDSMSGEKPTYEGPFAKTDFQKRKKPVAIVMSILVAASAVGLSVFSAINGGVPFNYSTTYEDTTSISMEYRVISGTSSTLFFDDEASVQNDYLPYITYYVESENTGRTLLEMANTSAIVAEANTVSVSGGETIEQFDVYYFEIPLTVNLPLEAATNNEYWFVVTDSSGTQIGDFPSISQAIETLNETFGEGLHVSASRVSVQPGIPSLGQLYLGLGIGYVAIMVYLLLRFRSRGFASAIIGFAASLPAIGLFALTRLPVNPTIMIAAVVSSLVASIVALYILNKEKEINQDSREKDKRALAFRDECFEKANAQSAHDILTYALMTLASLLIYFGLVPSGYSLIFIGAAFGVILGVIAVLVLMRPMALGFSKLSRSIWGSIRRSNAKQNASSPRGQIGKKQGSEQEETIFIGIND